MSIMNSTTRNPPKPLGRPSRIKSGDGEARQWRAQSGAPRPTEIMRQLGDAGLLAGSSPVRTNILEPAQRDKGERTVPNQGNSPGTPQGVRLHSQAHPVTPKRNLEPLRGNIYGSAQRDQSTPSEPEMDIDYTLSDIHFSSPMMEDSPLQNYGNSQNMDNNSDDNLPEPCNKTQGNKDRVNTQKQTGNARGLRIGSLNIHGKTRTRTGMSKYKDVCAFMRKHKLAILATQETRMDENERQRAESLNPHLQILNSGNTTAKDGVGFVINKASLPNNTTITMEEIVIGTVAKLSIQILGEEPITLINVHIPNEAQPKRAMLTEMAELRLDKSEKANLIFLGDWNCVTDPLDRLPHHSDEKRIHNAMENLTTRHRLVDGWRWANEFEKGYTHTHEYLNRETQLPTTSLARIDRIYIRESLYQRTVNWDILDQGHISDHEVPICEILKENQPFIGKGFQRIQHHIINHTYFTKKAKPILEKALASIKEAKNNRTNEFNPQTIWMKTKNELSEASKKANKEIKREFRKAEIELKNQITNLQRKHTLTNDENKELHSAKMAMHNHHQNRLEQMQNAATANYASQGEQCSKYWFQRHKTKNTKEIILRLYDRNNNLTDKSENMVKTASKYHGDLQAEQKTSQDRQLATRKILAKLDRSLSQEDIDNFQSRISYSEVAKAISQSTNGKASGLDGIPYEFYKMWKADPKKKDEICPYDTIEILQIVFNDIEEHGVTGPEWAQGIMALLYKKKDKMRIENYRPITLLNGDYKLMTKVLANRLGKIASRIIHPNQAGFVPGRSLYDSTRTSQAVIEYCQNFEENGCIIALDQEKAYDRIAHDYLWETLEKFKFPTHFINTIKTLYKSATTIVTINDVLGNPIKIERGVRQGDPMSCILYDLAIEPLAAAIRKSELKGFQAKGQTERLIASLFADDTLVYMKESDDINIMFKVIDTFCTASTANFNIAKTEYLPVGSKAYRQDVIANRKFGNNKIPDNVKIVVDGEAMRTLGAWIGNEISIDPQWQGILERQKRIMETWASSRPSYKGKELIAKALVQSVALFLATVNHMPDEVVNKMQKGIKNFLWDNRPKGYISWAGAVSDRTKGGLNMPDIKLRVEAIKIMWLQKYLAPPTKRPIWAYFYDEILFENISNKPIVEPKARTSWILQNWHERELADNNIPPFLRGLLKAARKYNVGLDGLKFSQESKNQMPMWHHMGSLHNMRNNKKASRCLRDNHGVITVQNALDARTTENIPGLCNTEKNCNSMLNNITNILPDRFNPDKETPIKDNLDFTNHRKEKYRNADVQNMEVLFDPDTTEREHPAQAVRIFQTEKTYKSRKTKDNNIHRAPAYRKAEPLLASNHTVYAEGASTNNGNEKSIAGSGIYTEGPGHRSKSIRIPGTNSTNQKAELVAILVALQTYPHGKLSIKTDSIYAANSLVNRAKQLEDVDYVDTEYADVWKAILATGRQRTNETLITWVEGHTGEPGNEAAHNAAINGTKKEEEDNLNLNINPDFKISGARLAALTQKSAYRLLLRNKNTDPITNVGRRSINRIKEAIEEVSGKRPTDQGVWSTLWKSALSNKFKDFQWKLIHDRLRCGMYFKNITNLQDRANCRCGAIETPQHIFFDCKESGQASLWNFVRKLYGDHFTGLLPNLNIEVIKGLGFLKVKKTNKSENKANSQTLQRIIATTVWTIWKLRNKAVIEEQTITSAQYIESFKKDLYQMIATDLYVTKLAKFKNKNAQQESFNATWKGNGNFIKVEGGKLLCPSLQ
jgi:ribonuclease HI/exonuclease III